MKLELQSKKESNLPNVSSVIWAALLIYKIEEKKYRIYIGNSEKKQGN